MATRNRSLALALILMACLARPAWSQTEPTVPAGEAAASGEAENGTGPADQIRLADALRDLQTAIDAKQGEIETAREKLKSAEDETSAANARAALEGLVQEKRELEHRFSRLATQADESLFTKEAKPEFDPKQKVLGLLEPVFDELEDLTANSREISQLEATRKVQVERRDAAKGAVSNLERLLAGNLDPEVRKAVEAQRELWSHRLSDADAQITSIDYELTERRKQQKPFIDSASSFVRGFLRTRGFNLLLGLLAFAAVFFGLGGARAAVMRMRPARKREERRLSARVVDLFFRAVAIVASVGALLFVFNATGDWFLLGITLAFLLGLGWVAIKAAPQFAHQITLVLNMGSVREGHYIVFDGVPWKVLTLGFTATLENDRLDGGKLLLPVRMLVGMHSRALGSREELFPCRKGDWVRLEDGTTGKVDYQTPAVVQLVLLGGSQKTYVTSAFLGLNPQNLSTNYRVNLTFGIDYRHQADATEKIPKAMEAALRSRLVGVVDASELLDARVGLAAAGASSLDFDVRIDVAGAAAPAYAEVERSAVRILVDACTENGWEIPFQQVTLHSATA
jgi:hypothetical protein